MSLLFAHGAVQWLAADAATTNYVVTGLGFQPKAIRFYWQGLGSATDTASTTTHIRRGIGFTISDTDRRCVASLDLDNSGNANCATGVRADAIAQTLSSAGATDGLLDLTAIGSDGFTLTVDDQVPVNVTVFWEAWGGDGIAVAVTGEFQEPAATGNVDYTVTGFVAGATDQVVMFAGVQSTGATPSAARNDSGLSVGAAVNSAENIVIVGNSDDASATMETDGYPQAGECVAMIAVGGGDATARAQLTQYGTNNFRLNWIARAATGRKSIFLAIKGGAWKAGAGTINNTSIGNTATVSGLPFVPIGVSTMWAIDAAASAGVSKSTDGMSLGTGSGTGSRRAMGSLSGDALATSFVQLGIQYDQIATSADNSIALDLSAWNSDGFTLITEGGTHFETNGWFGYLVFGNIPAAFATSVSSAATASGALSTQITPAAAVTSAATATAALTTAIALVSDTTTSASAASGELTDAAASAAELEASVSADSASSAALTTEITPAAVVSSAASVSAALSTAITPASSVSAAASTSAALTTSITPAASVSAAATSSAQLTTALSLSTAQTASAAASAALTTSISAAASVSAVATASATLDPDVVPETPHGGGVYWPDEAPARRRPERELTWPEPQPVEARPRRRVVHRLYLDPAITPASIASGGLWSSSVGHGRVVHGTETRAQLVALSAGHVTSLGGSVSARGMASHRVSAIGAALTHASLTRAALSERAVTRLTGAAVAPSAASATGQLVVRSVGYSGHWRQLLENDDETVLRLVAEALTHMGARR